MKVRIGFFHKKSLIKVKFKGEYFISDKSGCPGKNLDNNKVYDIKLIESTPSEHEWYEKTDTVFDVGKLESHRDKYYLHEKSTRVIKVGSQIGKLNNFEYWLLEKTGDMEGKIYPSGDYKYKKLIKKDAQGKIFFNGVEFKNKINMIPANEDCSFVVEGVNVGIDFHWVAKFSM